MESSPLLGSAYLLSQSPIPTVRALPATPSLCLNLSLFKSHLKSLRSVDDSVILRMNRADALSRSNASSRPNRENSGVGAQECAAFWNELVAGWNSRSQVLEGCLNVVDGLAVKQAYGVEKGLDRDRKMLGRGESEAEVKRRQIHTEVSGMSTFALHSSLLTTDKPMPTVEAIIRSRSITFFTSRCPDHPMTDLPPLPTDSAVGGKERERDARNGRDGRGGVRWNG